MKEMQKQPTMMTIREIAGTGLMSEHALRMNHIVQDERRGVFCSS